MSALNIDSEQIFGALGRAVRALANRRRVRPLTELDEALLRDIGLSRQDVAGALAEPLFRDPSRLLVVRAVNRRAGEWARLRALRRPAEVAEGVSRRS